MAGELRRVLARRLVRTVFLLAAVGIVVASVITFLKTHPISDAAYQARAQAAMAQVSARTGIALCPPGQQGAPVQGPNGLTQPESISREAIRVHDPRLHLTSLKGVIEGVTAPLVILACLIGASVIGAEWPSRTITTILTWEPRRVRVLSAKLAAAIAVATALTLATLLLLSAALLPSALLHGTTTGATAAWWRSVVGVVLRAVAMAAIGTVIGFSIASVGRNTAAAMGALFAYTVVIERVVAGLLPSWQQWLLIGNAAVFVGGKKLDITHGRTPLVAGLYLSAVAIGLYVVAANIFQRRDVA